MSSYDIKFDMIEKYGPQASQIRVGDVSTTSSSFFRVPDVFHENRDFSLKVRFTRVSYLFYFFRIFS